MNANDVIEAYVADVALRLPRRQRNDVAFELRALLHEALQARAAEAGREADVEMALAHVRSFGRPADVAARYRPPVTVIDPAHGQRFWRMTFIGLGLIWAAGLWSHWQAAEATGLDVLQMLGRWWGGTVVSSLWWPGVLVMCFAMSARVSQRTGQVSNWTPKAADRIHGGRAALVLGMLGIVIGLALLANPHWILDTVWNGGAAPVAYEALTYTDTFLARQAPWLFAALALNLPLFAAVLIHGRWTPRLRQFESAMGLITCALMVWTVFDGPVLRTAASDGFARAAMALIAVFVLLHYAVGVYRRVRPAPHLREAKIGE